MTSFSNLETLLNDFPPKLNDVLGAMVVTLDGRVIANARIAVKQHQIAAMTSSSLALGTRLVETINGGTLSEVMITGSNGNILIYAIAQKAVLVVVTSKSPNVALINWEARRTIEQMTLLFD